MEVYSNIDAEINEYEITSNNTLLDQMVPFPRRLIVPTSEWEYKHLLTLCMCMAQMDLEKEDWYVVTFDDKDFCEVRGIETDSQHRGERVKKVLSDFQDKSLFLWTDPKDRKKYRRSYLVTDIDGTKKGKTSVILNLKYKEEFSEIKSYVPYFINDMYQLSPQEGQLFLELRNHWDDRYDKNRRFYTVDELRRILSISEDAYFHEVRGVRQFNREMFEKTFNKYLQNINEKCKTVLVYPKKTKTNKKGDKQFIFFEKIYDQFGNYVSGYTIEYKCFIHTKPTYLKQEEGEV